MLLTSEQSKQWQKEGIEFLQENEFEEITCEINDENEVRLFPLHLPADNIIREFDTMEIQGKELLSLKNKCQYIVMEIGGRKSCLKTKKR